MATFTIGGGNQGNISPFLTGKATPMSLPPGYLSSAEQQAARMQKAISGAGEEIGDAMAAYGKSVEEAQARQGAMKRLESRALAAIQGGALADPASEASTLMKDIADYGNKNAKQQKMIYADTVAFLDRQEKERDQLDARYLRGLQTDLVRGEVREMEEGQSVKDALNDLKPWGELGAWEEGEAKEKETQRVSQAQQDTLKAAKSLYENPALQQAVRDAAGKAGEVGVDIWEGIKSLVPQQAPPQSPEQMFPELKGLDDEQKAAIRNFLNLKKRQPVGPGGLPQGDLPELPPLPLPDERLRQPLPMIEGEEELQFKWDEPPTPGQVRRANEIIPGLEPPVAAGDSKETDPKLTQKDIDEQEKSLQESLEILKGANQRQQRISQILAQQGAGGQTAPPAIRSPTPSRQEPAWFKPYQQQMRYLESKGHKTTKALRDAVKAAAMDRFPEGLKEVDTGHAYVVTNDGKVVFQVKKDIPKEIPVGAPMIFDLPNGRQGFRDTDGKVELIPETTNKGTKPTADQSNAYMYGMRMRSNAKAIDKLFAEGDYDPTGLIERVRANVKWDIAEIAKTENDKEFLSASQNWIAAVLRKESGARIDPDEYSDAAYQYFPALGDSEGTVKRKAQLRKLVEEVMLDVAGGMTLEEVREQTEGAEGGIRVRRFGSDGKPIQ